MISYIYLFNFLKYVELFFYFQKMRKLVGSINLTDHFIFMLQQFFSWYKGPTPSIENYIIFSPPYNYDNPRPAIFKKKVYSENGKIIYTMDFFIEAYHVHKIPTYHGYYNLFEEMKKRYHVLESKELSNF